MSKINISFNNKNYSIDESSLSSFRNELKTHFLNTMNGTGATISLDGVSYNIDSVKLSNAANDFVAHLGKVSGNGDSDELVAGLYQTGAIARYKEQGAGAIRDMMITPWDELVSSGAIIINDGGVFAGAFLPDDLPEKNEYGFYFGVMYWKALDYGVIFYEDGSVYKYEYGTACTEPSGTAIYDDKSINMYDWWEFQVSSDGLTLIDNYNEYYELYEPVKLNGDLIVPNDRGITALNLDDMFTGIIIPNTILIVDYAFSNHGDLVDVVISDGITSIGQCAFSGCCNLVSVSFPDSLTSIGLSAFMSCENLVSVSFPDSLTSIGDSAFANCSKLESVSFPDGLTKIEGFSFSNCYELKMIEIPASVINISWCSFDYCRNLNTINFNGTMAQWNSITKGSYWNRNVPATYVQCLDGTVEL